MIKITYFVHGTTTDNENGIATGWNQGKLSKLGRKQSVDLRNMIKGKKFDFVFCSDLKRAVDSAKLTFGKSLYVIKDKRLRECNYGRFNGKRADIVYKMKTDHISKQFIGGESYKEVEKRMRGFLNYLKNNYSGKSIAIVSHQGPQLALDVILKGKTWKKAMKEDWRNSGKWKPGWGYKL
ncbi:histidine phosphatase family protein [archaeon]|nr:histidine phosphatase family protein [archaeon]